MIADRLLRLIARRRMGHRPAAPSTATGWIVLLAGLLMLGGLHHAPAAAQPHPDSLLNDFAWRNIGPANMMGRISAIDALEDDFRTVLIGVASGGVWKSTNAGTSFTPIFDEYGSQSIGDVAFFQGDPDIIWVGTGEASNRNSVGWGDGIYTSTDGGETFTNMGLEDTYQIAAIAPHPTDSNTVYVAAIGDLWSYQGRRGLFKTTDGGQTWTKLTNGLPDDGKTGASVVKINPQNPDEVYVGMYQRLRKPWSMDSGGPNGGIFKSTDGGASWTQLTNGLPEGDTGMIDIDIYRQNPDIVMAYVEASDNLPHDLSVPGPGVYRSEDGGDTWTYQFRHNSRPYYHGKVRVNPSDDQLVHVVARHFYYSEDGGETYEAGKPFPSHGGDDHDLWISPHHEEVMYQATDQGAYLNLDGEAHIGFLNMPIGQYYEIGVDMRDPYWVYGGLQDNGGWGIPSQTRSQYGIRLDDAIMVNGGDGFHMTADPTDWRTVYTTAQAGAYGRMNMATFEHTFISPTPQTTVNLDHYYAPDFDELPIEYTINAGEQWLWRDIPSRTVNGSNLPPQFRWNWNAPLAMSPNNPRTIYVGSNYLFKSVDRGETWHIISPDLTRNNPATRNPTYSGGLTRDVTGAENHHTIYTISESPVDARVIWVGTDDGNVQVTRSGGASWTNVRGNLPGLPDTVWVSQVVASHHGAGTAYVVFDNHRMGDRNPYVFKTTDYGATWTDLSDGIPREHPGNSVHTLAEDRENENLLFVGTEFGAFVSIDGGATWHPLMNNLPPVAVRDLEIHPREADLIAGTHGRSIWIMDDITPLQQLSAAVMERDVHLFASPVATQWLDQSSYPHRTGLKFNGANPPGGAPISFYVRSQPQDSVQIRIRAATGDRVRTLRMRAHEGINRVYWDLTFPPSDAAVTAMEDRLRRVLTATRAAVERTDETDMLLVLAKDLLADHRAPDEYDDAKYGPMRAPRVVLRKHLSHVATALDSATTADMLNDVREQLVRLAPLMGDDIYLDRIYGRPVGDEVAQAGAYHIDLTVGGRTVQGDIHVRHDPMRQRR
jgi:photosystem II stability/assembly factor-like uncharacterized protein